MELVWAEVYFRELSTRDEDSFFLDAVIALSVGPISLLVVVLFVRISKEGSIMRDIEDVDIEELTDDIVVFILLDKDGEDIFFVDAVTGDVVGIVGTLVSTVVEDVTISFVEFSMVVLEESRPISMLDEELTAEDSLTFVLTDEVGVFIGVVDVDSSIGETDGLRLVFIVGEVVMVTESTSDEEVTELALAVSFVDAVETAVFGDVVGMGRLEDTGVLIVFAGSIDLTMVSEEKT